MPVLLVRLVDRNECDVTIEVKPDLKDGRWVGQHFIKQVTSWDLWECQYCGRSETDKFGFSDFKCTGSVDVPLSHRIKALPVGSPMRWGCKDCSAEAKTVTDLGALRCDGPEETQVHSGPAAWLCGVGSGHVCGEPEPKESILEEAQRLVTGDRQEAYSHPKHDFATTAKF